MEINLITYTSLCDWSGFSIITLWIPEHDEAAVTILCLTIWECAPGGVHLIIEIETLIVGIVTLIIKANSNINIRALIPAIPRIKYRLVTMDD